MGRKRFLALVMALTMLFTLMAPALTFATGTGSEEETPGAGTSEVTEEANEQGSDTDPDEGDGAGNDAGDTNTGADNTGDTGTGDAGADNTGDTGTGDSDTGDVDTGDVDTGDTDTGDTDTGADNTGDTGDTGTGDSDTGDTDTGDVDTGDVDTGADENTDAAQDSGKTLPPATVPGDGDGEGDGEGDADKGGDQLPDDGDAKKNAQTRQVSSNTIIVKFTNSRGWDNVCVYYWNAEGHNDWPGKSMDKVGTNDYNEDIYQSSIPDDVTGIIFTGKKHDTDFEKKTSDITSDIINGQWWYATGGVDDYPNGYALREYSITVGSTTNGSISADKTTAALGKNVTLNSTPDSCYTLDYFTVDGSRISGSSFLMPNKDVTVSAVFKESHNLTAHPAVAATCTTAGNIAYWSCDNCGKCFYDKAGTDPIAESDRVLPALGHDLTLEDEEAPTCTETGHISGYSCSRCSKHFYDNNGSNEIGEGDWVISALGHNVTGTPANLPTCIQDGNSAYWFCNRCSKYFSDAAGEHEIEENSWVIPATGEHTYVDGVCSVCNEVDPASVVRYVENGFTKYATSLLYAVEHADSGSTVTLLADDSSLTDGAELVIDKSLTIDGNGYTIYGKPTDNGYNDIFINAGAGDTITIKNVTLRQFGSQKSTASGHAPIWVSTNNRATVVIDNVTVKEFNRTGIFLGGGNVTVQNCYIDCNKSTDYGSVMTKGIETHYAVNATIKNTTIVGANNTYSQWTTAGVEVYGTGNIVIEGCSITSLTNGIAISDVAASSGDDLGTSNVTVKGCTVTATDYALDNSTASAVMSVESGSYTGEIYCEDGNENGMAVSGGTFDHAIPAAYCADCYIPQDLGGGLYSVQEGATITFENYDGTELLTLNVAQGGTVAYTGEDPAKATDASGVYTWSGWSDGNNTYSTTDTLPVAGTTDVTYTATFSTTAVEASITKGDPAETTYYPTFTDAYAAAAAGDTVTLLKDITVNTGSSSSSRFAISKSLTIDGANHTISINNRGFGVGMNASSNIDVTFKDVTILNQSAGARCIDTRGNIGTLTLDHTTLSTHGAPSGYTQPLTIGGDQSSKATVNIVNGSVIKTNDNGEAYYAIITFNPVNMTIDHSTIMGWACIYAKGPDGSAGSAGSVFTITNSTLVSKNAYSGETNAFAMFMVEDDDVTFNVTNTTINLSATGDQNQAISSFQAGDDLTGVAINLGAGNNVTMTGDYAVFADNGAPVKVSGGTFNVEVPADVCADGYIPKDNGNGTYGVEQGATITFENYDGTELLTLNVAQGGTVAYTGEDPAKATDASGVYTWSGWSDGNNTYSTTDTLPAATTTDVTYTATFSSVNSVASVTSGGATTYYTSMADAIAAVPTDGTATTITILKDFEIDATKTAAADRIVVTKPVTIDFGEYTMTVPGSLEPTDNWAALYIDADTTVKATTGGIYCADNGSDPGVYAFNVRNGAKLTIDGGSYHGGGTIAQAQLGTIEVLGGTFTLTPFSAPYNSDFAFNCVDANYTAGTAKIEIKGGTFVGFDPQDNKAEGEHTDFTANGYVAIETSTAGTYVVQPGWNVTFDADGGAPTPDAQRVAAGNTVAEPTAPAKDGFLFGGWFDGTNAATFPYTPAADVTLTAQWTAAVASITKNGTTTYYATLAGAVAAAEANDTITILKDFEIDASKTAEADRIVVTKPVTIDFGEYTMTVPGSLEPTDNWAALFIDADTTVKATTGGIYCADNGSDPGVYAFNVRNGAKLTIDGGSYHGGGTIAQAQLGTIEVLGGTFTLTPFSAPYNSDFAFNCVDANYTAGTAKIEIKGGTFVGFDPQNNAAEGANTDFTANGYVAIEQATPGTFVVKEGYNVTFDTDGGTPETIPEQRIAEGGKVTKPADPTRIGYIFAGWYEAIDTTTTPVTLSDTAFDFITNITGAKTLYAKWEGDESFFHNSGMQAYTTASLNESINLNLYLGNLPEGTSASDYSVRVVFNGSTYMFSYGEEYETATSGLYRHELAHTYAYQMTFPITYTILYNDDVEIITITNYSVMKYMLNRYYQTDDSKEKDLMKAALDYGAVAQEYFAARYETDVANLANKTTNPSNVITATRPSQTSVFANSIDTLTTFGAWMVYDSVNYCRIRIGDSQDLEGIEFSLSGEGFAMTKPVKDSSGLWMIQVSGLTAPKLGNRFTLTMTKGSQSTTFTYSAYVYANNKWNNATDGKLSQALVAYGDAAKAFFG